MSEQEQSKTTKPISVYMHHDELPRDDVTFNYAEDAQLQSYAQARQQLAEFKTPQLFDQTDPHSHLIFGLLNGTSHDMEQESLHDTKINRNRQIPEWAEGFYW